MAADKETKLDRVMKRPDWSLRMLAGIRHSVGYELNRKKKLGEPIVVWDQAT